MNGVAGLSYKQCSIRLANDLVTTDVTTRYYKILQ